MANTQQKLLRISIKSTTWTRQSHGLFDYQCKNMIITKNLKIKQSSFLQRLSNTVTAVPSQSENPQSKILAFIQADTKNYRLSLPSFFQKPSCLPQDMWLVVKDLKPQSSTKGYKLSQGDIIRLGRVQLRVIQIVGFLKSAKKSVQVKVSEIAELGVGQSYKSPNQQIPIQILAAEQTQNSQQFQCRICCCGDTTEKNPLITPCNCTGSVRFIHLQCLQRWLQTKITAKERENSRTYFWKNLECEICKLKYPDRIQVGKKVFELFVIEKYPGSYIMMETLERENINKIVHLISLQNKSNIRLGRGPDSDIRITDISVSRSHSNIRSKRSGLYLEDNDSKFGTLVKIRKPVVLTANSEVSVQCGRTILKVSSKKKKNWFRCFSCCSKESYEDEDTEKLRDFEEENESVDDN